MKSPLDRLLDISFCPSEPDLNRHNDLPVELRPLYKKNGLFAFESALEVFPLTSSRWSYTLHEWNDESIWIGAYKELAPIGICFAQDLFGGQFVFNGEIYTFDPEMGSVELFARDLLEWADKVLTDYDFITGHSLAHAWQLEFGPIPFKHRLIPITPFVLGGAFSIDNLYCESSAAAMRMRADLALTMTRLPDGTQINYETD